MKVFSRNTLRIVLFLVGTSLIIYARINGLHMTEGEQLVEYSGHYAVGMATLFASVSL